MKETVNFAPPPKQGTGLAIASLILGILSLPLLCCPVITPVTGVLAAILGAVHLRRSRAGRGMAIAGVIMGVLGAVLGAVLSIWLIVKLPELQKQVIEAQAGPFRAYLNQPAVDFTATDLQGQPCRLSNYKGKVVVLNFWATWCPPCRKEIPDLVALQNQYRDKGLVIVGLSNEDAQTQSRFAQQQGINYPLLIRTRNFPAPYNTINAIPTTFMIDSGGVVRQIFVGSRPRVVLESALVQLLK